MSSLGPVQPGAQPSASPRPLGVVAAALAFIAAGLTIAGSFLPIFSGQLTVLGSTQFEMTVTSWGFTTSASDQEGGVPNNGLPLIFAALLLILAGLAAVLAIRDRAGPRARGAAVLTTAIGTAFLAGVVWTVLMQVLSLQDTLRPTGAATGNDAFQVQSAIGLGLWLFIGATLLGIVATALALRLMLADRAMDSEPITPRYGFPAPTPPPANADAPPAAPPWPPTRPPEPPQQGDER
ncbi:hypothetical protein ABZ863_11025 [Saccharomonospora sp. NPDC046836]|uniref:hypothetical protein n=1 Tax=Saccharomonospora sp. NPDC046836 TaxID=3156921 RepID=UPI0033F89B72